jgi:chromate transporter
MLKLLELFITFFIIGLFTIGGGYAMIPMINDTVIEKGWLTLEELYNFIAIAESTPGPFAVNTATLIGFSQFPEAPILGALITTLGVILPSFIIILLIAKYLHHFLEKKVVRWSLNGIKATVVGLIVAVFLSMVITNVFGGAIGLKNIDIYAIIITAIIFTITLVFKKKVGPIPLIILSGILGCVFYYLL